MINSTVKSAKLNTATPTPATAKTLAPAATATPAPYTKELQAAKMAPAIVQGWQALYEKFLQTNPSSPATQPNTAQTTTAAQDGNQSPLNTLLETNFFTMMQNYLNPKTFPKLLNDPQAILHTNYATKHLFDATARLASITSINTATATPTVTFSGDCRDKGIIVNIQNNTDAQFSISQTSLDGTQTMQIGQLNPGLNEVNLHTAALQNPSSPTAKGTAQTSPTSSYFQIFQLGTESSWVISIKMMTGAELLANLTPVSSAKPNIFLMNGQETDSKYIAIPNHIYVVLTNQPTTSNTMDSSTLQAGKRVQALDITEFTGPFLMTLQINPVQTTIKNNTPQSNGITTTFNQPSMVSVQVLNPLTTPKEKSQPVFNLPLIIFPQFLWQNLTTEIPSILQAYWTLATTTYLSALTNFAFINKTNFGNAFDYFNALECFNEEKQCRVVIDLYKLLQSGQQLNKSSWIIGSNLLNAHIDSSSDIPQIHATENSENYITGNDKTGFYINFYLNFNPKKQIVNQDLFSKNGFSKIYQIPHLYNLFFNFKRSIFFNNALLEPNPLFVNLTCNKSGITKVILTDKKKNLLNEQSLYFINTINNIDLKFLTSNANWHSKKISQSLLPTQTNKSIDFKLIYNYNKNINIHSLNAFNITALDKMNDLDLASFSILPITNLYYDLYKTFQGEHFTRCYIIQNGNLPSFLANLSKSDWSKGIYLIPTVNNPNHLNDKNPGSLTITFYKSDKTFLGKIDSSGLYQNNSSLPGIRHPVSHYSCHSNSFNPFLNFDLSSGILLKYADY